jgi:hypothetical protein
MNAMANATKGGHLFKKGTDMLVQTSGSKDAPWDHATADGGWQLGSAGPPWAPGFKGKGRTCVPTLSLSCVGIRSCFLPRCMSWVLSAFDRLLGCVGVYDRPPFPPQAPEPPAPPDFPTLPPISHFPPWDDGLTVDGGLTTSQDVESMWVMSVPSNQPATTSSRCAIDPGSWSPVSVERN